MKDALVTIHPTMWHLIPHYWKIHFTPGFGIRFLCFTFTLTAARQK